MWEVSKKSGGGGMEKVGRSDPFAHNGQQLKHD